MKILYDRGLWLPEIELWMDARAPRSVCFVSHAHADHIGRHRAILATAATARLCAHRQGAVPTITLQFGERREMDGYHVTLFPAGHCLGSAQALVEFQSERVVYTGDFKLRPSRTSEAPVVVACDTLVLDATFGDPVYLFPDEEEVLDALCREIDGAFAEDAVPVVIGYALGKGQEALALLVERGYSVAVHRSILQIVEIYREFGVRFDGPGSYGPYSRAPEDRTVLLVPPGALREASVRALERKRTIYLSGWGMKPSTRFRYGTDSVIPLSDHAGYDDLLRYIAESGARRVITLYGDPDFSGAVERELGVEACHLDDRRKEPAWQPRLF